MELKVRVKKGERKQIIKYESALAKIEFNDYHYDNINFNTIPDS